MFWTAGRRRAGVVVARAATRLAGVGAFEPFSPDVLLQDGQDLGEFGLAATVVHFPGHSPGSVGVLTAAPARANVSSRPSPVSSRAISAHSPRPVAQRAA